MNSLFQACYIILLINLHKMQKSTILTIGAATLAAGAILLPLGVMAQNADTGTNTFITTLAEKLGISEDKLETALDETHDQMHTQREEEMQASIDEAVANGDLTQRQADLLEAMHTYREENRPEKGELADEFEGLTHEEMHDKMEELRDEREEDMLAALNDQGLNTNQEELDELHEAMQDLDLLPGRPGHRGPGRGMGMGMMGGFGR